MAWTLLWCGFTSNAIAVEPIVPTPIPTVTPVPVVPDKVVLTSIKSIDNSLPPQQLGVQGEIDKQQQPVTFDRWLVPLDATLKLLDIKQQQLPTGEIELTSPYLQLRLHPIQVKSDPQLGRVITIGELQKFPGLKVGFEAKEIAIKFS